MHELVQEKLIALRAEQLLELGGFSHHLPVPIDELIEEHGGSVRTAKLPYNIWGVGAFFDPDSFSRGGHVETPHIVVDEAGSEAERRFWAASLFGRYSLASWRITKESFGVLRIRALGDKSQGDLAMQGNLLGAQLLVPRPALEFSLAKLGDDYTPQSLACDANIPIDVAGYRLAIHKEQEEIAAPVSVA